jgi:hypothetical protein
MRDPDRWIWSSRTPTVRAFLADDLDVAEWYRVKLELNGYQVRIVPRTPRPINLDEYVAPDLLFLDVTAGPSGYRRIQQSPVAPAPEGCAGNPSLEPTP